MKTTILKSAFLMALTAGMFSSCVKDDNYSTPQLAGCTGTTLVKNREVTDISFGTVVAQHVDITPGVSDVIEAYVVSSDIGGNFFKSISCQTLDGSQAFSIPVDATDLFINYEPGRKVLINMDGLYTDNPTYPAGTATQGKRIGGLYANSSGGAEVGRLSITDFTKSVQPSCTKINEDGLVQHATITQLLASNDYLNKLIELDNVMFDNDAITSAYYDVNNDTGGATNLNLVDQAGNAITFRTSAYANFSAKSVATGSGKVRGVLTKYGQYYQFMARSESDINLTNPRFYLGLNEQFTSGQGSWTAISVSGAQTWTYSATYGNPGGMMKMSGYAGGNQNNEDWLISPAQDLSTLTTATLSLDNAYKFAGPAIEVLVSNNYSGTGSPLAAGVTWTTLTLSPTALSTGNYVYANTGALDISAFTGTGNSNVRIAIKYTSNTSAASTWEVDNVKIVGN